MATPDAAEWWLGHLENWWQKTDNPLHVWQAIAMCLNVEPPLPIPNWCLPYLKEVSSNVDSLARGRDFTGRQEKLTPKQAHERAARAFKFGPGQGGKNAFVRLAEGKVAARHVARTATGYEHIEGILKDDAIAAIERERNVTPEHARKLFNQAKRIASQG